MKKIFILLFVIMLVGCSSVSDTRDIKGSDITFGKIEEGIICTIYLTANSDIEDVFIKVTLYKDHGVFYGTYTTRLFNLYEGNEYSFRALDDKLPSYCNAKYYEVEKLQGTVKK